MILKIKLSILESFLFYIDILCKIIILINPK